MRLVDCWAQLPFLESGATPGAEIIRPIPGAVVHAGPLEVYLRVSGGCGDG